MALKKREFTPERGNVDTYPNGKEVEADEIIVIGRLGVLCVHATRFEKSLENTSFYVS